MDADSDARSDELMALESICSDQELRFGYQKESVEFAVPSFKAVPRLELTAFLPQGYPSKTAPVFELSREPKNYIDDQSIHALFERLHAIWRPDEVCLWSALSALQEFWEDYKRKHPEIVGPVSKDNDLLNHTRTSTDKEGETRLDRIDDDLEKKDNNASRFDRGSMLCPAILSGEPLTEKRSTFQAHLAEVTDVSEVEMVMSRLLENNKIRNATHNIMSYRIARNDAAGSFLQDFDDDGEHAAGGRLLHLLQMVDAQNVVVVVSRWFGGILLGPARFGLINKVARDLLEVCGKIEKHSSSKKKQGRAREGKTET